MAGLGAQGSKDKLRALKTLQKLVATFGDMLLKEELETLLLAFTDVMKPYLSKPRADLGSLDLRGIKDSFDLEAYVSNYVTLRKMGASLVGLCPFHAEKTPSFYVTPTKQRFKCFGCGRSGSIFDFVMEQKGISFGEALGALIAEGEIDRPELPGAS